MFLNATLPIPAPRPDAKRAGPRLPKRGRHPSSNWCSWMSSAAAASRRTANSSVLHEGPRTLSQLPGRKLMDGQGDKSDGGALLSRRADGHTPFSVLTCHSRLSNSSPISCGTWWAPYGWPWWRREISYPIWVIGDATRARRYPSRRVPITMARRSAATFVIAPPAMASIRIALLAGMLAGCTAHSEHGVDTGQQRIERVATRLAPVALTNSLRTR
jgi:hypothetical protein